MKLSPFGRKRSAQDLDAEVRSYLDALAEEKIRAGLSPQEAKRQARIEAGGIEQVKEEIRSARAGAWIDTLLQDVRYTARTLRRSPGYAALVILTFALGIGANTALFSVVNGLLLHRLPYRDSGRLFYVSESWPHEPMFAGTASPDFANWRRQGRSFDELEAYGAGAEPTLMGRGAPERLHGTAVTRGFFGLLGAKLALGRTFTAEEDRLGGPAAVILSDSLWRRKFGAAPDVVGKTAILDGHSCTIVGVLPSSFVFPDDNFRAQILVPMALPANPSWYDQRVRILRVLARLKRGVTAETAQSELYTILRRNSAQESPQFATMRKNLELFATPLRRRLSGDIRFVVLILQFSVALVLLIGCFNVANLQLARSITRWREMAVRAYLGAGRARLIRQLLTESLLLSFVGAGAGLVLADLSLRYLKLALPANLQLLPAVRIDYSVLLVTTPAAILVGILTAIAPAMAASKLDLTAALKDDSGRTTGSLGHQRLRGVFVTSEIALAIVLLTGSGLLIRSFLRLTSAPLGFEPHDVLTMRVSLPFTFENHPEMERVKQAKFFAQLLERAKRMPGVEAAAIGEMLPTTDISRGGGSGVTVEGQSAPPPGGAPTVAVTPVSAGYFRALGIPLLRGRSISDGDADNAPRVEVVNHAFADRFFPGRDAVGKRIRLGRGPWEQIVGVVGNVRRQHLRLSDEPRIYTSYMQLFNPQEMLILKSRTPKALVRPVTNVIHSIDPTLPVDDIATMEDRIAESLSSDRTNMLLMGIFAALGLIQAAVGIFAVIAYMASRRSHEIAIRMALGAQPREALLLVLRQGIILTICGVAIGTAGAMFATRALRTLLYGVTPGDPITLLAVVALLTIVALLVCYMPARRAAQLDPAVTLRHG
jgi:putative ABC transport system permease protein